MGYSIPVEVGRPGAWVHEQEGKEVSGVSEQLAVFRGMRARRRAWPGGGLRIGGLESVLEIERRTSCTKELSMASRAVRLRVSARHYKLSSRMLQ